MSLQKDGSGRRWVAVEVEIPGTPEKVWEAIASGPGVSSWFVPTEREGGVGGKVVSHFGPGMDSVATMTAWDPPHRFAAESDGMGPGSPPMATEWTVEAREGGKCLVRVVHSLFASTDDWDKQLESVESGWPSFFQILRLYVANFAGQPCSAIRLFGATKGTKAEAWESVTGALALSGAAPGGEWKGPSDLPAIGGRIEQATVGRGLVMLDKPGPGIGSIMTNSYGPMVFVTANFYFYGPDAAGVVGRDEAAWQKWMAERFPMG